MITKVDLQFRQEVQRFDLRATCEWCAAFDVEKSACAYGYPVEPHRHLALYEGAQFVFCKAFELA